MPGTVSYLAYSKLLLICDPLPSFTAPLPLTGHTENKLQTTGYTFVTGAFHSRQIWSPSKTGFIVVLSRKD